MGGRRFDSNADFAVTAHWGIASTGRLVERDYTDEERDSLGEHIAQLGGRTFDIYLNEKAYWSNVPGRVWDYTLGGYQVLKKWLSYRESALLGRALRLDEVEYFTQVIRRIAALRILGPELDANYAAVKADLFDWAMKSSKSDIFVLAAGQQNAQSQGKTLLDLPLRVLKLHSPLSVGKTRRSPTRNARATLHRSDPGPQPKPFGHRSFGVALASRVGLRPRLLRNFKNCVSGFAATTDA